MNSASTKCGQLLIDVDNKATVNQRRLIFLDTETTGLSRERDRICEVAAIEVNHNLEVVGQFHTYINPRRNIPYFVTRIHGLTNQFLSDKPVFSSIAPDLAKFLEGAELYAHNMPFDSSFLNSEFKRNGFPQLEELDCSLHCTCMMAKKLINNSSYSLNALLDFFRIDRSNRKLHGALIDTELLVELYKKMISIQNQLDQNR